MAETKAQQDARERYEMDLALLGARDKTLKDTAKGILSGTYGLPSDILELFSGAFTQGAAEKALRTTPPGVQPDEPPFSLPFVQPRPERRPEQVGVPKVKYTSADLAQRMGLDPYAGETLAAQVLAPDPLVGLKAAKLVKLAELGFLPWMAGVFASKRAKTLPKLSLANAEKLEEANTPAQKIFKETGFWRGPEGQWRFEISDKDIKIDSEVLKKSLPLREAPQYAPLADVVTHPELFAAYPELENAYIKFLPPDSSGTRGAFRPDGRVPRSVVEDFENIPTDKRGRWQKKSDDLMGKMTDDGLFFRYPVIEIFTHTRDSGIQKLHRSISTSEEILENQRRNLEYWLEKDTHSPYIDYLRKNIDEHQTAISKYKKEIENLEAGGEQAAVNFDVKSTLVHELQHAIQEIENLPTGGRPLDRSPSEYQSYLRLGGEAEARAAQERLKYADVQAGGTGGLVKVDPDLPQFKEWKELQAKEGISPEDALTQTPLSQYDVPLEELSFVYPKEGKAKSAASQILSAEPPPGPIFTSPALNAVREVSKDALPANQWLRQLQGRGVKEDEIVWTGVGDWLKSRKGNVSKADLEQYLDANQIQIQEVLRGRVNLRDDVALQKAEEEFSTAANDLISRATEKKLVTDAEKLSEAFSREGIEFEVEMQDSLSTMNPEELRSTVLTAQGFYDGVFQKEFDNLKTLAFRVDDLKPKIDSPTKFSDPKLQLPGGENYRELVLTLPSKGPVNSRFIIKESVDVDGFQSFEIIDSNDQRLVDVVHTREEAQDAANQYYADENPANFTGGHYDEPNIVAHIRFNERVIPASGKEYRVDVKDRMEVIPQNDPYMSIFPSDSDQPFKVREEGSNSHSKSFKTLEEAEDFVKEKNKSSSYKKDERVLFIEEIQSDWAQTGREKGFLTEKSQEIANLIKEKDGIIERGYTFMNDAGSTSFRIDPREKARYNEIQLILDKTPLEDMPGGPGKVPSAPFIMDTNQWVALSLKRMVRWAADNKFDKIGWTTGAQQAARYDLSKQVDAVYWNPSSTRLVANLKDSDLLAINELVPENKLHTYIGKEAANKILKSPANKENILQQYDAGLIDNEERDYLLESYILEGVDLEIGGEGMKGFYDQIVNDQAKALGKKYGAKVELEGIGATNVPSPLQGRHPRHEGRMMRIPESAFDAWTLNLTHQLKDAARKGLPYMVVLPPVVIGSQMMQEEAPVPEAQVEVPAAQVRASRILEEAVL